MLSADSEPVLLLQAQALVQQLVQPVANLNRVVNNCQTIWIDCYCHRIHCTQMASMWNFLDHNTSLALFQNKHLNRLGIDIRLKKTVHLKLGFYIVTRTFVGWIFSNDFIDSGATIFTCTSCSKTIGITTTATVNEHSTWIVGHTVVKVREIRFARARVGQVMARVGIH